MRTYVGVFSIFMANLTFAMGGDPCSTDSDRRGLMDEPVLQALFGPSQGTLDCMKQQSLSAARLRRDADYFDSYVADLDFRGVLRLSSDVNHAEETGSQDSAIGLSHSVSNPENKESENQIRTVRGYSSRIGSESKLR